MYFWPLFLMAGSCHMTSCDTVIGPQVKLNFKNLWKIGSAEIITEPYIVPVPKINCHFWTMQSPYIEITIAKRGPLLNWMHSHSSQVMTTNFSLRLFKNYIRGYTYLYLSYILYIKYWLIIYCRTKTRVIHFGVINKY